MGKTYEALLRAREDAGKEVQWISKVIEDPQLRPAPRPLEPEVMGRYRELSDRFLTWREDEPSRMIAFTGTTLGDGCSTAAMGFATALAMEFDRKVLLVDANLRDPVLHRAFGIDRAPGLWESFEGDWRGLPMRTVLQDHLFVVSCGRGGSSPIRLFESVEFSRCLKGLLEKMDYILLDTPPATVYPDARLIGSRADGIILVVHSGKTRKQVARRAKEVLERSGGKLLGVILNRRKYYIPEWIYRRL